MSKGLEFYQELVDFIVHENDGTLKGTKKKFGVSKKEATEILVQQGYSVDESGKWSAEQAANIDGFSNAEIELLRELISDVQQQKEAAVFVPKHEAGSLPALLQGVSDEGAAKVRRTFTVDEDVMHAFDAFCEQNDYTKSHVITVALKQLLQTYQEQA